MGLIISYEVFSITEQLATVLQTKQITLSAARSNAMIVVATLKKMRCIEEFDIIWQKISQSAGQFELSEPVLPKQRKPPRRLDQGDPPYAYPDCVTYHRVESWFSFLDTVGHEIEERFSQECLKPIEAIEIVLLHAAKGLPINSELN